MSKVGNAPKFLLYIKSKDNPKDMTRAGALFTNEYGGFSLKLSPGIVLKWDDDVFLNLNPYLSKKAYARRMQQNEENFSEEPPGGDELEPDEKDDEDGWQALDGLPEDNGR